MASQYNNLTTANGWLKEVTGEVNDVRPDGVKFTRQVKFMGNKKLGEAYVEPVWLSHEQGFTYDAGTTGTGFDLNNAEAALSDQLRLSGAEIVLTSRVGIKQFAAAVDGGKQSFGNFYKRLLANMAASFKRRVEITSIYGGRPIGTASAFSGSGTTRTVTIATAKWAPGIWSGGLNAYVDVYNATDKLNDLADVQVTQVIPASKQIVITGNATDLTAINAAGSSADFYFKGAYGNEMTGIVSIAANVSAVYADINASTYDLWQGNPVAVGSADLTWDKIQEGVEAAVGRGLDEAIRLYVSIPAWGNLNSDLNALRVIDSSYSVEENELGQKSISYYTICGKVTVEPSIYVMYGDAFFIPEDAAYTERIGSTDITWEIPGQGGEYFTVVQGKNAVEFRAYTDQAVLERAPNKTGYYSGIVSS